MDNIKKKRGADWNYGGTKWKLSRSKIDLFVECPRCFYIDNKLGYARPKFPAFLLNTAVDILLKKEFDKFRKQGKPHPLMNQYNIDAVPFTHSKIDEWRENFVGVQYFHEETGMTISGAIDDLWLNKNKELHIVDYKSTSKEQEINLDDKWKDSYKRQMEVYQWLMRKNDFLVSDKGYFVYANGNTGLEQFDAKLEFDVTILEHVGDTEWVEPTIFAIKETLESPQLPKPSIDCEHCQYHYARVKLEDN
jgi:CRISPR/Cas system-associated exonuclease Cas4 (RecB family)